MVAPSQSGGLDPAEHYDHVTAAWNILLGDELHFGLFSEGVRDMADAAGELTRLMVGQAQLTAGLRVVDIGCGTGYQAIGLAERGAEVVGLSTSRVGVTMAEERAASAGVADRVTFLLRDGRQTGLAAGSCDVVWLLESAQYMRPHEQLIAECTRLLRPGGRLVLCDVMLRRALSLRDVRRLYHEFSVVAEVFGDSQLGSLSGFAELSAACGLEVLEEIELTEATRSTFDCWIDSARRNRASVVSLMGEPWWARFIEACAVLRAFWLDGTLGYGLLTARRPAPAA